MQILQFFFDDFWHFIGLFVLIGAVTGPFYRSDKED